jgi:hypothetical protein
MAWLNGDNLYRKYGTEQATVQKGGEYRFDGPEHMIELKVDLTTLTETETILSDTIFFPKGARITKVDIVTHTAAATGVAIDVGFIRSSDRSTEIDYDGLVAAFPTASMNVAGETTSLTAGVTYAGALVGTTTATYVGHISASRTTATAFTAGVVYIRVYYYAV